MAQFTFTQPAPEDSAFAREAFDSQIGKVVPFRIGTTQAGSARLIAARVASDGLSAKLTVEVPDNALPEQIHSSDSFGFSSDRPWH